MTGRVLLDTSAIIALLRREPGADVVEAALQDAAISAVNAAEPIGILIRYGDDPGVAETYLTDLGLPILDLDAALVTAAGTLAARQRGTLSLGDAACLATAAAHALPVLTAERPWAGLGLAQEIRLAR